MQTTGIIRKIDDLGRIVLPKELRKYLSINTGDDFQIIVNDDKIILEKYSRLKNYQDDIKKLINCINSIYNYDIYFSIDNVLINQNEKLLQNIVNIIQERKIYILEKESIIKITDNIKLIGKVIIYPIVINSDLLGSIIIVGKDKIDNLLNVSKLINNVIKNIILNSTN